MIIYLNENKFRLLSESQESKSISAAKKYENDFSIDVLRKTKWKDCREIINYCYSCNLSNIGEGIERTVFSMGEDTNFVIKVIKHNGDTQNLEEIKSYLDMSEDEKEMVPVIFDYDRNNSVPMWIISEKVLSASYSDFPKLLGCNFGSYTDYNSIKNRDEDLSNFSDYDFGYNDKNVEYMPNLMEILDEYEEYGTANDDFKMLMKKSNWWVMLYKLLSNFLVSPWELENIDNWGLVYRNGETKLVILDIGI